MKQAPAPPEVEETLDSTDPAELRLLGHRMLDDLLDYLETVRERPAWQPLPPAVKERLRQGVPWEGSGPVAVYREFSESVLPYPTGNIHPRFWGWVTGTGTQLGMLAVLGLGTECVRRIDTDGEFRIRPDLLERAIDEDLDAGRLPLCVVGSAGTVTTGAIDDLAALADLCARHALWFHVDGAFGALAALSPRLRDALRGMERADSLAFDLHKWMYMPYEAGVVLVRDPLVHRAAFTAPAAYLSAAPRGIAAAEHPFNEYGVELSRGFKALKVWLSLKADGIERYARLIEQNVEQARYLAGLVQAHPALELLAPVPLNVVCLRYVGDLPVERLDDANAEILMRVQERGIAVPTAARVRGAFAIRCAIANHRSRREDFDALVDAVVRIGAEVERELER